MRNVVLVRIDDRLIHGQVCTAWIKETNANVILIVDEQLAKDEFALEVLESAKPDGIEMIVKNAEDAVVYLNEAGSSTEKVMILVKGPGVLEKLIDSGVSFERIILGNMAAGPGRKRLEKTLSVSQQEIDCMKRIEEKGTPVVFQQVPYKQAMPLKSILK